MLLNSVRQVFLYKNVISIRTLPLRLPSFAKHSSVTGTGKKFKTETNKIDGRELMHNIT